eukprot:scaffold102900_cov30-Tisochrysis_lutea.AAC.1
MRPQPRELIRWSHPHGAEARNRASKQRAFGNSGLMTRADDSGSARVWSPSSRLRNSRVSFSERKRFPLKEHEWSSSTERRCFRATSDGSPTPFGPPSSGVVGAGLPESELEGSLPCKC